MILDIRVAILETFNGAETIAELVGLTFAVKDGEAVLEQFLVSLEALRVEALLDCAQVGLSAVAEVTGSLGKP